MPPLKNIYEVKMGKNSSSNERSEELLEMAREDTGKKYLHNERTYEFYNIEEPGLSVKFAYGPTNNPKRYNFWHGEKYTVPIEVAEHVERSQTPIWSWRPNGVGGMVKQQIGWRPRFQMREVRT